MDLSWRPRPSLVFGSVRLSIQASEYNYCTPRESGIPFEDYTSYEVAIFRTDDRGGDDQSWLMPSDLGMPKELDEGFSPGQPGGYIPKENVERIKIFLAKGMTKPQGENSGDVGTVTIKDGIAKKG